MPELPEVEILVRQLRPLLQDRAIQNVHIRRPKLLAPTTPHRFVQAVRGGKFSSLVRRGKYLVFTIETIHGRKPLHLLGHLGMTGRMYLLPAKAQLPKHAAVILDLGRENFVFEDMRYFGRFTLDLTPLERLGPEPLEEEFTVEVFRRALRRSTQSIKVKLLDQSLVAGVGNIYASEALFRAGISPRLAARRLSPAQVARLWHAVREVLAEAIEGGSTVPLDYSGVGTRDGLFYFGRAPGSPDFYEERLQVYDREGKPCNACGNKIRRLVQAGRSTYFCSCCQRSVSSA